jgi:hypothetical protein
MTHWSDLLPPDACTSAVEWARSQPDYATAWAACQRGDWLLWLVGRMAAGEPFSARRKPIVRAAARCAALALPYVQDEYVEGVCLSTIQACVAWTEGEATDEETQEAAYAADAAYAAAAAYAASAASAYAAYASAASAASAYAATDDAAYAYAASAASAASAYAASATAAVAARARILAQCADLVRAECARPRLAGPQEDETP